MGTHTRGRVLVVDNNQDVLTRLGKELTEAGYETTTTWSGVEALRLLEDRVFDSLLVDDYLPDLYIGEFLEKLSALPIRPRVFVMQGRERPILQTRGSLRLVCVDKSHASRILEAMLSRG